MIAPWMTADKLAHEIHSDVMASEVEIADAIDALVQREVRKAVLEEREACAVIAESKVKFNRQMATVDGWVQTGMTLRDWFAGHALAGLCASASGIGIPSDEMAGIAYSRADAMIAEGSNKDGAE